MNCGLRIADCGFKQKVKGVLLFALCSLLFASSAFAHKVNIFAYAEGDTVYTESYFPDGRKVEGGTVEVYDSKGNKLLEGATDQEGQFNFKPLRRDNLKIVLIASMGHKNSYGLSADELPDIEDRRQKVRSQKSEVRDQGSEVRDQKSEKEVAEVDFGQIKKIIDASLDERLRPIIKELKRQKEEVSFREIIAGIGYIFGIFGIILYFMSRRRRD
ncbi:hypothetical protein KKC52_07890 [bacterium]|nr:hypothetical protein [bacterium]